MVEILIIWLLFGIVSAVVASNKGRSGYGWFVLGVLLGPFGFILALVVPKNQQVVEKEAVQSGAMKKCPYCAEEILDEAIKCRFCGEMLVKKKGCLSIIVSTVILIASAVYAIFVWGIEHSSHGHGSMLLTDPNHLLSLILVVGSAFGTWRSIARRRSGTLDKKIK